MVRNTLAVCAALATQIAMVTSTYQNPSTSPTPPMGFNNWARFMCELNQTLFTDTAEAMMNNGLLDAGYNQINLDDCWMNTERGSNGSLVWNSTLFPDGLIWLGHYLHDRGFKFGIYEDAGNETCGGYPGSKGFEEVDVKTFENWGIDYVKVDGCNVVNESDPRSMEQQFKALYTKWHQVLSTLEKPMVFSESAPAYFSPLFQDPPKSNNTPWYQVMDWIPYNGELARHSDDVKVYGIDGVWQPGGHWESIMTNYGFETLLARYQKCGYYNDPDFLIAGYPDLTLDEMKSQFALWASFSAPLIISAYIPELSDEVLSYLTNKDIIAIDQDKLCQQATLVSQDGYWDVLTKSLSNGDRLLTVLNRGNSTNSTSISTSRVGLTPPHKPYEIKDLWTGHVSLASEFNIQNLPSHGTAIYRISAKSSFGRYGGDLNIIPTGMIFNTFSGLCLTSSYNTEVIFKTCSGIDEQVWKVKKSGLISSLKDDGDNMCLNSKGGLESCDERDGKQLWLYGLSGNLVNRDTYGCLTTGEIGEVSVIKCGRERDEQVFGLPGGMKVVENW